MKNPSILELFNLEDGYSDYVFNVSDIAYYYIIPANELEDKQVKFKTDVAGDELVLVIIFKDGTHKGFSLARHSMTFSY